MFVSLKIGGRLMFRAGMLVFVRASPAIIMLQRCSHAICIRVCVCVCVLLSSYRDVSMTAYSVCTSIKI